MLVFRHSVSVEEIALALLGLNELELTAVGGALIDILGERDEAKAALFARGVLLATLPSSEREG